MQIAVIGCGAMGGLYSAYLSQENNVTVIDTNKKTIAAIQNDGIEVMEPDGTMATYHPNAATTTEGMDPVDLVIIFVKSTTTKRALHDDANLIGPNTYLLTLQNGGGHEKVLSEFVQRDHIIVGTTQHNAARNGDGKVRHGGSGLTVIGPLGFDVEALAPVVETFNSCGIETRADRDVQRLIWNKLFTNVSASALTALFQMPLGYIVDNPNAWTLCERLIREAVKVAAAAGYTFEVNEKINEVRNVCEASPQGVTSIQSDIAAGRRTEVDTITGFVVDTAYTLGVSVPCHWFVRNAVHAFEGRGAFGLDTK